MTRLLAFTAAALLATPAAAHEASGVFHLHPHGGEALLVGLAFAVAVAVWALVKPRVFAAYLGFAVIGAVLAGLAWQALA